MRCASITTFMLISSAFCFAASDKQLAYFDTTDLAIGKQQIVSGGVPRDGIPSLTDPHTMPVKRARFIKAADRVVGVTIRDEARAYPINVLTWHEAINDTLNNVPIVVAYCPLCDSVSVFQRRIDDTTLTFGISGLLHNSNVLLYDRSDRALWSQLGMRAVSGPHAGESLKHLPFSLTTFSRWKQQHEDSTIVTFRTGHQRNYRRSPYEQYFASDRLMFPVAHLDARLPRRARIVGVVLKDEVRAYPVDAIAQSPGGRLIDFIDGQRVVLEGDRETGAVRIAELPEHAKAVHSFWFAWAAFHPNTKIVTRAQSASATQPTRNAELP